MVQSPFRVKPVLATLLPLLIVWVSVACLSICLDCCTEEEAAAVAPGEESSAGITEIGIGASHEECRCPIPASPECALQKSYVYQAQANEENLALPVSTNLLNVSARLSIAKSGALTPTLKPPLQRLCVLKI
jgi:hypothetical protein